MNFLLASTFVDSVARLAAQDQKAVKTAAYAWAERRRLQRHPKTGTAWLVEIRERVEEIVVPSYVEARARTAKPCASYTDDELLGWGYRRIGWRTPRSRSSILLRALRLSSVKYASQRTLNGRRTESVKDRSGNPGMRLSGLGSAGWAQWTEPGTESAQDRGDAG